MFFFKQKTAYEKRISDWSSYVCSSDLPITTHVLDQIGALYKIEAGIRGSPRDVRRAVRQEQAKPTVTALHAWLREQLPTLSRKSETALAIGYAMNQIGRASCRARGRPYE